MEKFGMDPERRVHRNISTQEKNRLTTVDDTKGISKTRKHRERL